MENLISKKGMLLFVTFIVFFSGCRKEKLDTIDPNRLFLYYTWSYNEEYNYTQIEADFLLDNSYGPHTGHPSPWAITFNNDSFIYHSAKHYIMYPGLVDSGTLVYTDAMGVSYTTEIKPIPVLQIPDTFTSVTQNVFNYFYWVGDSLSPYDYLKLYLCTIDSSNCVANTPPYPTNIIELYPYLLSFLTPGINNTHTFLLLERSVDLPNAAPKGGYIKQTVYGKRKTISVY